MFPTESRLRKIAAKASTLAERIAGQVIPLPSDTDQIEKRLEQWCQVVSKGNWEAFARRLAWDGLTLDDVRPLLGEVTLPDEQPLPHWAELLAEVAKAAANLDLSYLRENKPVPDHAFHTPTAIPFQDFFLPFVNVARQHMLEICPAYAALAETAQIALEQDLLRNLSRATNATLQMEFWISRVRQQPILAFSDPQKIEPPLDEEIPRESYIAFIEQMVGTGFWSLCEEYPVMARLAMTMIERWLATTRAFLDHLTTDLPLLRATFGNHVDTVAQLSPNLSDPHRGGYRVIKITFASGLNLIYKPRPITIEKAYQELMDWLNQQELSVPMKALQVLDCGDHGWVEFVSYQSCTEQEQVERYYTRVGILIGLMYALSGSDFHYENILIAGEHPIPIDLEMLVYPPLAPELGEQSEDLAQRFIENGISQSVLLSGILPVGHLIEGSYDSSFLGSGLAENPGTAQRPMWRYINTDYMSLRQETIKIEAAHHQRLNDVPQPPTRYLPQIMAGFEELYRLLLAKRDFLLIEGSPLEAFHHLPTRFVLRATRIYYKVLMTSLNAKTMRDGLSRSIHLEHLCRVHSDNPHAEPRFWKLTREELAALAELDIPQFKMMSDERDLQTYGGEIVPDCFLQSGYEHVRRIIGQLSEADLRRQRHYLELSLLSLRGATDHTRPAPLQTPPHAADFMAEAVAIADQLVEQALFLNGNAHWYKLDYSGRTQKFRLLHAGESLYSGNPGIALFLAAMFAETGKERYRDMALAGIGSVCTQLAHGYLKNLEGMLGGTNGLGAVAYALFHISQFLQDRSVLEDALTAVHHITPEHITADTYLDVISGAAGAILCLLPIYRHTRKQEILDLAIQCGQHLLEKRTLAETGHQVWRGIVDQPLSGFSHGAAGIAYALLQLYETTQQPEFLAAAQEAIAYERCLYVPESNNWLDLRESSPKFMTSWCHGAGGIVLARLAGQHIYDSSEIREDIEHGLIALRQAAERELPYSVDHLCCGNLGRAQILSYAGQKLGKPELTQVADLLMREMLHYRHEHKGYALFHHMQRGAQVPGFFTGIAGIGYAFLRHASQRAYPLILAWE